MPEVKWVDISNLGGDGAGSWVGEKASGIAQPILYHTITIIGYGRDQQCQ